MWNGQLVNDPERALVFKAMVPIPDQEEREEDEENEEGPNLGNRTGISREELCPDVSGSNE